MINDFRKGDIVIINNKNKVSLEMFRPAIDNGVPYYIVEVLGQESGFYIEVHGKLVRLFETDYEHLELIKVAIREDINVGDFAVIVNEYYIENLFFSGFRSGVSYEIVKVLSDGSIVIKNKNEELWININELNYVRIINYKREVESCIEVIEEKNIQNLIDEALDKKDFKTLGKLYKKIK